MTAVKDHLRPICIRVATPLGLDLEVGVAGGEIVVSRWSPAPRSTPRASRATLEEDRALLREARRQVTAYFKRALERFSLPLHFEGTSFECDVWHQVATLRFGEFVSYADIARAVGKPLSHRGVARAMGKTPLALFVPAHRIVGADGKPRGLSPKGRRAWLIRFERQRSNGHKRRIRTLQKAKDELRKPVGRKPVDA